MAIRRKLRKPAMTTLPSNLTPQPAIETRGLTKTYGGRPVVQALDLKVPAGCVYGFLGRNGSGKSTTIKMLTGMVHPDAGSARLLGEDVSCLTAATRAKIAYLAEGHPLYRSMTVDALERLTCEFYPRWNKLLFEQIIDHFGLPRRKKLRSFSNGMRAQVSLALAVVPDPELLIFDDPTLGLDTVIRRDFLESMVQIIQRAGRTIFLSSHMLGDIERIADRIGILIDGVLRVDCPIEHFRNALRKVVLEFAGTPKPYPLRDGVVSDCVIGRRRELVIANFTDAHRAAAEQLGATAIDVLEMNLEDAFIEYTRGPKRSLPDFYGDDKHVQSAGVQGAA
jgi:ABC-2 type transport system ATP-binding protein